MADQSNEQTLQDPTILTDQEVLDLLGQNGEAPPLESTFLLRPQFATRNVQPSTLNYIDGSTRLYVRVETSLTTVDVQVTLFVQRYSGEVDEVNFTVTGQSAVSAVEDIRELLGGYLLGVSATTVNTNAVYGSVFITVGLARGGTGSFIVPSILIQGYLPRFQFVSWPTFPVRSSIDGPGNLRTITGTVPGAGNDISETVPSNRRWRLAGGFFTLTTSATVADRTVLLNLNLGGAVVFQSQSSIVQPASKVRGYSIAHALPLQTFDEKSFFLPIPPDIVLKAADTLTTAIVNLQAGDTITAWNYQVEEWLDRS